MVTLRARLSSEKTACLFGLLLFQGLLYLYVERILFDRFDYLGFTFRSPGLGEILLTVLLSLLPGLLASADTRRPSTLAFWLLYLMVGIPTLLVGLTFLHSPALRVELGFSVLVSFCLLASLHKVPLKNWPALALSERYFLGLWVAISVLSWGYLVKKLGLPHWPDLAAIYLVRKQYELALESAGGGVAYLVSWHGGVIAPLLFLYGLTQKRAVPLLVSLVTFGTIFCYTGFKTALLLPVLLAGLFLLAKKFPTRLALFSLAALFAGVGTLILMDKSPLHTTYTSYFFRRVFVVPGQLSGCYFQFFSEHAKVFLSGSQLGRFLPFPYPYAMPIPHLIGQACLNHPEMNANANFMAEAYANFGSLGMVFYSALLAIYLWVWDDLAQNKAGALSVALLAVITFSLANSGLLTCLVTHGLALALVALATLPKRTI